MIDTLRPKKSGNNISHSTVIKAMCINGLGFTERRLYLFACEADARIAAEQWLKENELYEFTKLEIKTKSQRLENKKGIPRKCEDVQTFYLIGAEIKHDQDKLQGRRAKLGGFILATNDLESTPDQLLK